MLLLLALAHSAEAEDLNAVLEKTLPPGEDQGWLTQQWRKFRSHPHLDRAYRLINAGRLDEARIELELALEADPSNEQARIEYLHLLGRMQAHELVVAQADILLKHGPAVPATVLAKSSALASLGRTEDAAAGFRAVTADASATPQERRLALSALADAAMQQGRFADALEALEPLRDRDDFGMALKRASANQALAKLSAARVDYTQALRLAADDEQRKNVLEGMAQNAVQRQDWKEARRALETALEIEPSNASSRRTLVEVLDRAGDKTNAIERASDNVRDWPANRADRQVLANLRFAHRDFIAAAKDYEALLALTNSPEDRYGVYMSIGHSYYLAGARSQAAKAFQEALNIRDDPKAAAALAATTAAPSSPPPSPVPGAELHLAAADRYLRAGQQDKGLTELAKVLKGPASPAARAAAYRQLGYEHYARGEREQAREDWMRLLEIVPDDPRALAALAQIDLDEGNSKAAAERLQRSVARAADAEAYRKLAYAHALSSNWGGAIEANQKLIALQGIDETERTAAIEKLARAHRELGQHREAAEVLQAAIENGRDTPEIRRQLGLSLFAQREWRDALRQFRVLLEREPSPMSALFISRCYGAMGKTGLAVHFAERALADATALPKELALQLYDELAYLYAAEAEYARAAQVLERLVDANPDVVVALRRAHMLKLAGDNLQAQEAFETLDAAALSSEMRVQRLDALSQIHAAKGEPTLALELLEQAVTEAPTADRSYRLGLAYFEAKRYPQAVAAFQTAFAGERRAAYAVSLGHALLAQKRYREAAHALEEGLALEPQRLGLYQDIAYAYLHDSQKDEAVKWFKRGIDARLDHLEQTQRANVPEKPVIAAEAEAQANVRKKSVAAAEAEAQANVRKKSVAPEAEAQANVREKPVAAAEAELQANVRKKSVAPEVEAQANVREKPVAAAEEEAETQERDRPSEHSSSSARLAPGAPAEPHANLDPSRAELDLESGDSVRLDALARDPLRLAPNDSSDPHRLAANGSSLNAVLAIDLADHREPAGSREKLRSTAETSAAVSASTTDESSIDAVLAIDPADREEHAASRANLRTTAETSRAVSARTANSSSLDAVLAIDLFDRGEEAASRKNARQTAETSPPVSSATPHITDAEVEKMRAEVRRLDKDFNLTLYQSYSPSGAAVTPGVAPLVGGAIPSQGGAEMSYRPPGIGFVQERTLDVFARMLWSNRPGELSINRDSLQAGVGIRYKPFAAQSLYVSAERLIKIGDQALNDWLLRVSYGWTSGYEAKYGERSWNYTTLYADAGYFTNDQRTRTLFGEARQGYTFRVDDAWLVTPHVVATGRYERPNPGTGSYLQAGPGVSIKYLFNATRYSAYRSSVELLAQYKFGLSSVASGWLFTAVFQF